MRSSILEKYDDEGQMLIEIGGSRFKRGSRRIHGFNTEAVGYHLSCSLCDWERKVNGSLTLARPIGRDHAREVHGIRGLENVAVW
jgi:hypothetical protein